MGVEIHVPQTRARRELWYRGKLRFLTREGKQREAYDAFHARERGFRHFSPFVWSFHRRLGKTFLGILLLVEITIRDPYRRAKFGAPSLTQAEEILDEHWGPIFESCPPDLYPSPYKNLRHTFRNPRWARRGIPITKHTKSVLRLYGVNQDRGNSMRGGSTDGLVLDECREMLDFQYTFGNVLLPTFKGRTDPFAIMISTVPESPEHPWWKRYRPRAQARQRYWVIPASENPDWTDDEDEMFADELGGRESPAYQREIECRMVAEEGKLIVPEFISADDHMGQNPYVLDSPIPEHYHALSVLDMGGAGKKATDRAGILFLYVDFKRQKLVVLDEIFERDLDTKGLHDEWSGRLKVWFPPEKLSDDGPCHSLALYSESTPQTRLDLARIYKLETRPVFESDRDAVRGEVRVALRQGRIEIHPRCKALQYQLRYGERTIRGDFARSEELGHCDLISSLFHAFKVAPYEQNPYPEPVRSRDSWFETPTDKPRDRFAEFQAQKPRRRIIRKKK